MNNLILNSLVDHIRPMLVSSGVVGLFASYSGITLKTEKGEAFFSLIPELPLILQLSQKPVTSGPYHPKSGKLNHLLQGGSIDSIDKDPDDRVIHLTIRDRQEKLYNLYYIGIPKKVELILTDQEDIIIVRTHFPWDSEETYQPQEFKEQGFTNYPVSKILNVLENAADEKKPESILTTQIAGIDKQLARVFLNQFGNDTGSLETLIPILQNQAFNLVVTIDENPDEVALLPEVIPTMPGNSFETFENSNEAACRFFRHKARLFELIKINKELNQVISKRSKKIKTIRKKLNQDLEKANANIDIGKYGDLILANMHQIKRGMSEVRVQDYFSENQDEIQIKLDPVLAPQENAEKFYKKSKKAKRGIIALQGRIKDQDGEEAKLQAIKNQISAADNNLRELRKVHKILVDKKWITQDQQKKLKIKTLPGKRFISSQGYEIIVGKNSRENEIVSFQVGKDNDFWMHAAGCPGSHVILKNTDRKEEPPERSLYEAAAIAAHYSKAKGSTNVQVHWTKRRFIKKVRGGAPGKVILSAYSSVLVTPEIPKSVRQNDD